VGRAWGKKKRTATLWAGLPGCTVLVFYISEQLFGGQQPQSPCLGNRLCPAADDELGIDIAGVGLDRVHREKEPGRDLWIGQPFGDELEYLELTFAQGFNRSRRRTNDRRRNLLPRPLSFVAPQNAASNLAA
jgi:hypothetical protein